MVVKKTKTASKKTNPGNLRRSLFLLSGRLLRGIEPLGERAPGG